MKKLLVLILALSVAFVFGCTKQETVEAPADTEVKKEETVKTEEAAEVSVNEEDVTEEEKETTDTEKMVAKTENASKKDKAETTVKDTKKPEEKKPEEKKAEEKETVDTEHIKKAENITSADELTALIEEVNDPKTTPERKEKLLEIIGEFLDGKTGQTVEFSKE